jgi:hypothetical protein
VLNAFTPSTATTLSRQQRGELFLAGILLRASMLLFSDSSVLFFADNAQDAPERACEAQT